MALVSVVVPVYHNAETLPALADRLVAVAATLSADRFEFVFVDDGSRDESFQVLQRLAKADDRLRMIRLSRNFGTNAALLAGLTFARGDCAVVLAADLQDPPELIPALLDRWRDGDRVVLTVRRSRADSWLSRLAAGLFHRLFRWLVFKDFPPGGFGFPLIDRQVIDIMLELQEKNAFIFGQLMWVGFRRGVVYYDREPRRHGRSGWTTAMRIKYFIDAFTAFSYVPLRAASILGMSLAVLGFLYAVAIVVARVTAGTDVPGWASLTVVVLVTSGVQLVLVGILGEYLWRVLDETRQRPVFIVESLVNVERIEGADRRASVNPSRA